MDVFLQSLLLAGIGVCVWLAFHPSSREDYDDIETPRKPPLLDSDIPPLPANPYRRGEGRLIGQYRGDHDDADPSTSRPAWPGDPGRPGSIP